MGKQPAFQFYPGDWTRDLDDQDLEIEGAWIRICCRLWWSETPGKATKTIKEWSRILRKTEKKTREIFQILIKKGIASGDVLDNQNATIISRRMVKDNEISQIRREVGKLGGNPNLVKTEKTLVNQTVNQNPTPSSSSSSSKKEKKEKNVLSDEDWLKTLEENPVYSGIEVRAVYGKMLVWCQQKGKKPTRLRFVNWLNREDRVVAPIPGNGVRPKKPQRLPTPEEELEEFNRTWTPN
ncbi:MAG TPA: hypothetical protein PLA72_11345 [Smithellaceae bacterium]|nr:hypothetical protein [Smithellaceae bacterium]